VVRDPRQVLREFGLDLTGTPGTSTGSTGTSTGSTGSTQRILVHDSTADCRYMVLPLPPSIDRINTVLAAAAGGGAGGSAPTRTQLSEFTHDELKQFVTRDSMLGVAVL